jgi:hypothetical protein
VSAGRASLSLGASDVRGLLLGALLALGAYATSVGHDFVYDDVQVIVDNPLFQSIANWRAIIAAPWWGPELYRPVTALTIALDWSLSGGEPWLFHLGNILMHVVTTALVFILARLWLPTFGATVAAVLFAVHPVHVEAVANVVGRAEVLAALFAVAAALAYHADGELARTGDRSWRRWLASFGTLALLALALGSKEIAFATPGIFLIVDWLDAKQTGERPTVRFKRHWVLWVGAVALTAAFLWQRSLVVGGLAGVHAAPGIEGEGMGVRVLVMAPVFLEYARLLLFPLRLSADYSPNFLEPVAQLTWRGATGLATVLLAVLVAIRARNDAPVVTFGLAFIGGTLLVVSNIIVPSGVLLAERSMYLPSVGLVIVLGWAATALAARHRIAAVAVVALLVGLGMVRTVTRVPVWKKRGGFFVQLVHDAPGSYRSFWVASALAFGAGNPERGEDLMQRALEIHPAFPNLWEFVALRYREQERWLESGAAFAAEFRLDSTRIEAAADAIVDFVRAGALDSAAVVAEGAKTVDPHDYRLKIALSDLALKSGRPLEAMTWRRQVARQFPRVWQYWFITAMAALEAGYCPEVTRSLDRLEALELDAETLAALRESAKETGCGSTG